MREGKRRNEGGRDEGEGMNQGRRGGMREGEMRERE